MYLERTSFDAVITDKNGLTIEADCQVTEPSAGGLAAEISINIPRSNEGVWHLRNPCSLRGANGIVAIEINELWYRSISAADPQRKHARYTLKINHAKQLTARWSNVNNEQDALRFILSPVRFLKEHPKAKTANYASTQNMTVELFSLQTAELGKIRFSMIWSVHLIDTKGVSAEIRPSFVAEIKNDGTSSFEEIVEKMREVLTALSIFTRQAITLHGWVLQKSEEIHKLWFDPLEPNLAPDMAEEPETDLCFSNEFESHAQSFVDKFLQSPPNIKDAVTILSIALAPHVRKSTTEKFLALFGALEEVVALEKLTQQENANLRRSDPDLIEALLEAKRMVEATENPNACAIAARLEGYANSVKNSGPSFNVRFNKFKEAHPSLPHYLSDLWPLQGSDNRPGLKQFRDALAHGLTKKYNHQAIAIAHWHFVRLAERLAFLVLGTDVPAGISHNSISLRRDPWYEQSTWRAAQEYARRPE